MTRGAGVAVQALAVAALVASTVVPLAPIATARSVACDEPATRRVSVSSDEAEARRDSETPSISGDGRFVAFASAAGNLAPGDDNDAYDVFVRDRLLGTTEIVSVATGGEIGNASSLLPAISVTGRFVAFNSIASNFVPGDVDPTLEEALDVFIHDRETHVTERVSVDSNGDPQLAPSFGADVSASGRFVAFTSAGALAPDDANATYDVYVRDRATGTTELISIAEDGVHQSLSSWFPSISGSGRFVAFDSSQDRLVPNDTNRWNDVFVKDRMSGAIEWVSVDSDGRQGRGGAPNRTSPGTGVSSSSPPRSAASSRETRTVG
jgi:Tol biopolymer transport system component